MSDDVTINIRTRGGRQASQDARQVASSVGAIGKAGHTAAAGLRNFRANTNLSGTSLYFLRHGAYVAAGAVAGIGAIAIKTGLQFNASMESNQVAFTQFLGSSQAARRELSFLYKTAAATPFEVPNITQAARQLLAFGFNAKETNSWLGTIGDTIAGMGGGPDQIDALVRAIGQIRSKGRLQGDELMQLSELGVVNRGRLAKDLGVTPLELMSGNANISARRALRALQHQFNDTFGGQSAKQARTFNGQLSTLHDNINMTLGAITRPAFKDLERHWFPALNASSGAINRIFQRNDLDLSDKITLSRQVLKKRLGPLVDELGSEISDMHLDQKLGAAVAAAIPRIATEAAHAGPPAAKAFVIAWWHSGAWGQLLSAAWLFRKLGAFDEMGSLAGARFGKRFVPGAAAAAAAAAAGYYGLRAGSKVLGGAVNLGADLLGADPGSSDPRVRAGRLLEHDPVSIAALRRWERTHSGVNPLTTSPAQLARLGYPGLIPGAPGVPRGYRPTVSRRTAAALHVAVYIDGKGVAHHVVATYGRDVAKGAARAVADAKARR